MSLNTRYEAVNRNAIGFEPLLRFTESVGNATFPPHNIERLDTYLFRLTLAVAGFSKEELLITVQDGILNVAGEKAKAVKDEVSEFVYRGIANRDFIRKFKIGEGVEITHAGLKNGLLTIMLQQVPEESKAKRIDIL